MKTALKISKSAKWVKPILAACYPNWKGRKLSVRSATEYAMSNYWTEGSRDYVLAYDLKTGRAYGPAVHTTNPMNGAAHATVTIPEGVILVEHTIFCGKDCGVTIHANPANMPNFLPEITS